MVHTVFLRIGEGLPTSFVDALVGHGVKRYSPYILKRLRREPGIIERSCRDLELTLRSTLAQVT